MGNKSLQPLIIGHERSPGTWCIDGLVGTRIAKLALPHADFIPWRYAEVDEKTERFVPDHRGVDVEFEKIIKACEKYTRIVIVDFSFPRYVLEALNDAGKNFTVLDHHETPIKRIGDVSTFSDQVLKLDTSHSGAALAWMHFFPDKEIPALVKYVEARDLWTWKRARNKSQHEYISLCLSELRNCAKRAEMDQFAIIDMLIGLTEKQLIAFCTPIGTLLKAENDRLMEPIINRAIRAEILGMRVPLVVLDPSGREDRHVSNVGHELCERFSKAEFAAVKSSRGLELRSLHDEGIGVNVEEIANKFGGGGHKGAAGCHPSDAQFVKMVDDLEDWHLDELK